MQKISIICSAGISCKFVAFILSKKNYCLAQKRIAQTQIKANAAKVTKIVVKIIVSGVVACFCKKCHSFVKFMFVIKFELDIY